MTDQDLQDWAASVDRRSAVSGRRGETPENVIAAGQAVADLISSRKGKSA